MPWGIYESQRIPLAPRASAVRQGSSLRKLDEAARWDATDFRRPHCAPLWADVTRSALCVWFLDLAMSARSRTGVFFPARQ